MKTVGFDPKNLYTPQFKRSGEGDCGIVGYNKPYVG
jgi:hypothetical protein